MLNSEQIKTLNEVMQTCADVRNDNIAKVTVTITNQNRESKKKELTKEEWLVEFFENIEELIGENFDILAK
ncbi:hypothetical protein [Salinicoccus albus]|uniref:hypothetical protein n=1 Tax=Salinicoccus albus TaxID=418756 RepID=UPI00037B0CCF|nr:hypothetical protein [Salinicoccus albus]